MPPYYDAICDFCEKILLGGWNSARYRDEVIYLATLYGMNKDNVSRDVLALMLIHRNAGR